MKEKIIAFFTDVTKEMKKVTWPHREELIDSTVVVMAVCGIIALFIYGVDIVVNKVLSAIL
jgi:preprotein translocase subunit SecE